MKLVKNLLLLAALVLGLIFIKNKFFSKPVDGAVQTEQTAEAEAAATSETTEATTAVDETPAAAEAATDESAPQ